jgi:hypothetical protein
MFTVWLWQPLLGLALNYENAGVSGDFLFVVLESSTYSEVSGSKGLIGWNSVHFGGRGFLRLDFVKLTGYAGESEFSARFAKRKHERSEGSSPKEKTMPHRVLRSLGEGWEDGPTVSGFGSIFRSIFRIEV